MKKKLLLAMIFLVVLLTPLMFIIDSESVTGDRCRRIEVDNSGNAETLTDYQLFLNISYDSDMQSDFDDLRFTWYDESSGQEVNIDYWLDKYVDSEYALVWIEIPSIRALGQEVIYMYYGDPERPVQVMEKKPLSSLTASQQTRQRTMRFLAIQKEK